MLQFFTYALNDKNALQTFMQLHELAKDKAIDHNSQLGAALNNTGLLPDVAKIDLMTNLHKNFWSMPFPARTVYLERILFPVDQTKQKDFDKAVGFVLETMMQQADATPNPICNDDRK